MTSRHDLRRGLETLLDESEARQARERACRDTASALVKTGEALLVGGWLLRDDAARALATLTQIAGELAESAIALLETGRAYGAAVLIRQIVEVEYLAYCFAADPGLAKQWLASSQEDIRKLFQPSAMRRRSAGRFRDEEYWTHCELGGHPNPKAAVLLPSREGAVGERWMWADLAQHLDRLWPFITDAVGEAGYERSLPEGLSSSVETSLAAWREADVLSIRRPISVLTDGNE